MTADEKTLAIALSKCTFVPGVPIKRFARDMAERAHWPSGPDTVPLTPKQRKYLCEAVLKFRRQIPREVVGLAGSMLAAIALERDDELERVFTMHEWERNNQP
jgi:hypothetical protein